MKQVKKAIVPVAGYGSRFLPYTKAIPKAMLPIINRPAIEVIIQEIVDSGIEEIYLIVGQNKDIIESHFSKNAKIENLLEEKGKYELLESIRRLSSLDINFVKQEVQDGTARAIALCREQIGDEPFAILLGDDVMKNDVPVTKQLIDVYNTEKKTVIGVKQVKTEDIPKYATMKVERQRGKIYEISEIIEKPRIEQIKSNIAPLGRYVCTPELFEIIDTLKPGKNGEYQLTDALAALAEKGDAVAYEFDGERYDMGDRFGFLKANIDFALSDKELHDKVDSYIKTLKNN